MLWQQYKHALSRYPLTVKATTAATLMSCSDVLGQTFEQGGYRQILNKHDSDSTESLDQINLHNGCPTNTKRYHPDDIPDDVATANSKLLQYDWERMMHVGVTGFTFSGPISHGWYNLLEGVVGRLALTSAYSSIAAKMSLDAILFSPIAVAGYFVWRSVLEGSDVQWKLEHKWMSAVQASWSFWPMANIVNFSVVPLQFRVLYNNGLSVLWNAYLSNVNQSRLEQVVDLQLAQETQGVESVEDKKHLDSSPCVCSHCRPVRG